MDRDQTQQRRKAQPPDPGFFDPRLRYRPDIAARYLGYSKSKLWAEIKAGRIVAIRDGGNTFVPGSAIEAACRAPGGA